MGKQATGGDPDAVRQELQAAYAQSGRAYMAKDATAVMGLVAPGFAQTMPDGQTLSHPEAEALLHEWFATGDVVTGYDVEIGKLAVSGDRAEAEIVENVATRFAGPDGRPHERKQTNTALVTWVRAAQGWQIARCDYRSGTMTVDGRAVSPAAPTP